MFREFLRSEYSEENMLFWLACEELKQEQNPEGVEEKARLIYEDYISILSPKEVSNYEGEKKLKRYELQCDKTYFQTYALNEDSEQQTARMRSLIRVFVVRILGYPNAPSVRFVLN